MPRRIERSAGVGTEREGTQSAERLLCGPAQAWGLVDGSGVQRPGIEVLTHGGEHDAKEPAFPSRDTSVVEGEVELLAFDGTLGTRAPVGVQFPKR